MGYLLLMNYLKINTFPYGFVANTDPSTEPGMPWVAFYFPSREKGEFFDSYGHPPEYYDESFKFETIETWNNRKLQSSWSEVWTILYFLPLS